MADSKLEIKMAKLETRIDEVVIPTLRRIERSQKSLKRDVGVKIKDHNYRIDGLEDWKKEIETATKTSIFIGKKIWLLIAGVSGGTLTLIKVTAEIYQGLR